MPAEKVSNPETAPAKVNAPVPVVVVVSLTRSFKTKPLMLLRVS